jgi:short-subunit dehydrogenase
VGDWEPTEAAFDKVKEVGEIDMLVNNAGLRQDGVFRKIVAGELERCYCDELNESVQSDEAGY